MDAVYSPTLAVEVAKAGGISCVHRFCSIEENVKLFKDGIYNTIKPWVSVGTSKNELARAEALYEVGADVFVIDVAHGAAIHVVEQYDRLRQLVKNNAAVVVGNFATAEQIKAFCYYSKSIVPPNAFKCNIGSGAACLTRVVTGVGLPSVETILECTSLGVDIIQDGGITNSGDFCKALALGAKGCFVGKLFAQCTESGAEWEYGEEFGYSYCTGRKIYRGSASASSYATQGKLAEHRAAEGDSYPISVSGPVSELIQGFDGGLRSSMSYLGAFTLDGFRQNCEYVVVTNNGVTESKAHGK
jgi:IMP dehydrogenase